MFYQNVDLPVVSLNFDKKIFIFTASALFSVPLIFHNQYWSCKKHIGRSLLLCIEEIIIYFGEEASLFLLRILKF